MLYDQNDLEDYALSGSPLLEKVEPHLGPEAEANSAPCPSSRTASNSCSRKSSRSAIDPGLSAVIAGINPNYPELLTPYQPDPLGHCYTEMTEHVETTEALEKPKFDPALVPSGGADTFAKSARNDAQSQSYLTEVAVAASQAQEDARKGAAEARHDSAHDQVPQLSSEKRAQPAGRKSPLLTLKTNQNAPNGHADDTIATSPTLAKHVITVTEGTTSTLPAYHPGSPTKDGAPVSPHVERLPSIRQVTGQLGPLNELADLATQQDQRTQAYQHHHSASHGSTTSQSPALPYHAYPNHNIHASPTTYQTYSATSPTSDIPYGSPTRYPGSAYFAERRTSASTDHPTPQLPPSLQSISSSGESHGNTSSGTDGGYSTNHTTPIDSAQSQDGTATSILPPPPGMPQSAVIISSGFKCDWPGCTAVPFQTQYLLSSHRNVHSQNRPHYCPVQDCPRSEGGKGFKRKNEMIRHGLVHSSPGYMCPFCPDREHRYPRPDNLQRHVRVHHVDKDRDDAELRAVLAQRLEGTGKTRRRRANTGGSTT